MQALYITDIIAKLSMFCMNIIVLMAWIGRSPSKVSWKIVYICMLHNLFYNVLRAYKDSE